MRHPRLRERMRAGGRGQLSPEAGPGGGGPSGKGGNQVAIAGPLHARQQEQTDHRENGIGNPHRDAHRKLLLFGQAVGAAISPIQ